MGSPLPEKQSISPAGNAWAGGNDPFAASPFRKAPYVAVAASLAMVHLGLPLVGSILVARGPGEVPAFPGFGLDLVVLLVFGPRYWPVVLAAYFAGSLFRHVPLLPSCGVAVAALIRTLFGVALLRWSSGMKRLLGEFDDLVGVALAGLVASGLGAALGSASLVAGNGFTASGWAVAFARWWIADALGVFTASPALLALARSWTAVRPKWSAWFALQLLLYMSAVAIACDLVFLRSDARYLLFTVFLLILIAAAWLGPAAARFVAAITSFAAIGATRIGIGAFAAGTLRENLENLALFLVAVSLTGMALGAFRAVGNLTLPAGVLLAGWACSAWLYASLDRSRAAYDDARLESFITSVEARIDSRYRAYEDLSWGAATFLAASGRVSPEAWESYVRRLSDRYPDVSAISMIEPEASGNAALTFDARQQSAAERSRDSGAAVLVRPAAGRGGGRLQLFVPVYRAGAPVTTAPERRQALLCWVKVAFSADSLLRPALADFQGILRLQVSDERPGRPFFVSAATGPGLSERTTRLTLGQDRWLLTWAPLPGFPYLSRAPFALAAGCTALLSLLLAGLVLILQTTMRRASYRWKLLESASALGTWELDLSSGMVHCSEQMRRLYGLPESPERLPVSQWLGAVHPDDREALRAEIGRRLENRQSIDWQYRAVWPDGSIHWLHSKALPVADQQERPSRIVGVALDISEIKLLQSQLSQAQKLQSVGQLAAGVAHEINTPIQYIGDNGKFLEESFRDLIRLADAQHAAGDPAAADADLDYLRAEVPKAASQLLEGVDQVARIVRAMKEFSYPGPIERTATDLNRAIENTLLVCKNEWKHVAEVTTDLDPDLPPVPCVAGDFNQVMLNLIVNAAHAISEVVKNSGGKGAIQISTRRNESVVEIRVADSGAGIPESIRSKVFDPFFTTKPVGKGTGQGLAIAHAYIVQKHKGSLTFESEPGRGTTFLIQLPLACANAENGANTAVPASLPLR
ncbi:MAG TPA: ATP-binding protein [Bryobacteraceae bacterium]|nr:ATP-binding protein [Bryobacteraceae bacterium]